MAHEIETNDGLVLAGTRAWHGLGTVLPERCDVMTAMEVAKLNWEVQVAEIEATMQDGSKVGGDDFRLIVREDTKEVFASCKAGYTPIQNWELGNLAYEISEKSEKAVESAGSLRNGRKIWFLLDMGTIGVASDDLVKPYLFISSAHDLSMRVTIGAIATRVVCANTAKIAMDEMGSDCMKIKHTSSSETRLEDVKEWLANPTAAIKQYGANAIRMAEAGISDEQLQAFFTSVWQRANGTLTAKDIEGGRRGNKYKDEVANWLQNFREDQRQTSVSTAGTVWAAYNSITQYANHERKVRSESTDPTLRTESLLFGTSAALNQAAYDAASMLVA